MPVLSLLLLTTTVVRAQQERIELPHTNMSVREVIKTIEQQSDYLFAFDGRAFDITRTVQAPSTGASVGELLKLITDGTDCSWLVSASYIVIHHSNRPTPVSTSAPAPEPRTSDVYTPSDYFVDAFGTRPPQSSEPAVEPAAPPLPVVSEEIPDPFSAWSNPDTYSPIRHALPRGAIKTDLLYGATTLTPNIGFEMGLSTRSTLEFTWGWNQLNHERSGERKLNHGLARAEYRRWFCERFDGHFVGGHIFGAKYNIGGYGVPGLFEKESRYEGWAFGAGVTYGYHLALARRWGLEFHVGVGVTWFDHTRFECVRCGTKLDRPSGVWFGPTRAGVDLVFMLWK